MSIAGFDRAKIIELLTELGRRLSAKGVAGRLYVVGGAAMALEFDTRRATRDIDAIFHPQATVAGEAASMATDLSLPPGWLSSAAQAFVPLPDGNGPGRADLRARLRGAERAEGVAAAAR